MLALKLERLVYCAIYRKTWFDSQGGGMTNVGFEIGEMSILYHSQGWGMTNVGFEIGEVSILYHSQGGGMTNVGFEIGEVSDVNLEMCVIFIADSDSLIAKRGNKWGYL